MTLAPIALDSQSDADMRDALLTISQTIVLTKGWPALSIRNLAAAAGHKRTALNDLFGKDDIIRGLLHRAFINIVLVVHEGSPSCPDIGIAARRLMTDLARDAAATCLMGRLAVQARQASDADAPWLGARFDRLVDNTIDWLADLCEASEREAREVVTGYIALCAAATANWRLDALTAAYADA